MNRNATTKDTEELLKEAGVPALGRREAPFVRAECMRLARRLYLGDGAFFGLVPIDAECATLACGLQLCRSLAELSGSTVAFLDANTRWPALRLPVRGNEGAEFGTQWLGESCALLLPNVTKDAAEAIPTLERQLSQVRGLFRYVIADLTGFEVLGEQEGAYELMDQLLFVARGAKTREADVLERLARAPSGKTLGVLLVD